MTTQFKKGDFVQTLQPPTIQQQGRRATGFELYGIVMTSGDGPIDSLPLTPNGLLREYLVHLQDGTKQWFWSNELKKATDDGS